MAKYIKLGEMLISMGLITEGNLQRALEIKSGTNKRLGEVLIENNFVTEQQIIEALQLQLGVDFVDLTSYKINPELGRLLSKNIAKKYSVVPVKLIGGDLYVAMVDPLNFQAIEDIKSSTRKKVVPMIATSASMERAIMELYGSEGAAKAIEEMRRDFANEDMIVSSTVIDSASDEANSAPTIRLVNSIIERAVIEGASDIHFEPREDEMVIRIRSEGILKTILKVPQNVQSAVTSRIKVMGNMDVAERRIPQDGRANVKLHSIDVDLRISTLPTIYGEKTTIRLLMKSGKNLTMDGIGLSGNNLAKFKKLVLNNSNGVILITGPTGSGKSSTMYTMLNSLNEDSVNIVTLEDPVEYNIDGINQVQINEKTGMTFASGLRSILRQDPDIISVGEIRDGETAEISMRAAITGHLVLSTIHTNNAVATLDRLIDIGAEPFLIASALKGVIAQRLVRRICPHCRVEYTPTREEEEMIGIPASEHGLHKFYKGQGCSECFQSGYHGRIGIFEILMITNQVGRAIHDLPNREKLDIAVKESGFEPMIVNGRELVLNGITTPTEVFRAVQSTEV